VAGVGGLSAASWTNGGWSRFARVVAEPWVGSHFSAASKSKRMDVVYTPRASYLGRHALKHVAWRDGTWTEPAVVSDGLWVRGLSLCALADGGLLCVYSLRSARRRSEQQDPMQRFTYTLRQRTYNGEMWSEPMPIPWPDVRDHVPEDWKRIRGRMGLVFVGTRQAGVYPTLPERAAAGAEAVPVAWMVPGFTCIPPFWKSPDRGGLLVTTELRRR
jgi:hypothetical protein